AVCLLILVVGLAEGREFEAMFTTAVAVAVAAIPEGLVVSLTVILALGMRRIFQRKALVRKLVAAETLGSTTVICVDKTGTLTEGKMKVTQWKMADEPEAHQAMILCNDLSNQTELALWEKEGASRYWDPQKVFDSLPRLAAIPFSSQRKFMATLHPWRRRGRGIIFAKGAPEVILRWCKMGVSAREDWERLIQEWSREGLRLIALASREIGGVEVDKKVPDLQPKLGSGFKFLGLVGLSDPLRPEVRGALKTCQQAGIRVVVLTGDYRQTAEAVMRQLGVTVKPEEVLEASVLEGLSPEELEGRIDQIKLFARVTPTDKLRIVQALQDRGEVVAMTGDGVNDALALKRADVGIVVGEATEVAKETADIVLLDSNFKTIVAAIEEGRSIFENMKKVIVYLLSGSFAEVALISGSLLLKLPLPITAAQILWVNLVEDGLPGMALAFEDREPGLMKDPPRDPQEPLLDKEMKFLIFVIGIVTDVGLFGIFLYLRSRGVALDTVRSFVFAALGLDSLFYIYACRSLRRNIWHYSVFHNIFLDMSVLVGLIALVGAFYIKPLAGLLKLVPLSPVHWAALFILAVAKLLLVEVVKWGFARRARTDPSTTSGTGQEFASTRFM
ncbi:HAD-IC family P-type ATPase, partial [Candidatus Parcubacteria bacterium]|nr:HAD-IC family P-type ATPase [Candidatus Parcubacteria bacterium]